MTDIVNQAAEVVVRKLTAAEVVYSLDFVTKLVKKVHKDNPRYSIDQIGEAVAKVFNEKLASSAKKLQNLEKVRRDYSVLRSAEPVVAGAVDLLKKTATLEFKEFELPKKADPKKAASKANGTAPKADPNQPAML